MPVLSWMRNDFQISAVMVNIKNHHLTQMKLAYISRYFLVLNEAWKFIFITVKYLVQKKKVTQSFIWKMEVILLWKTISIKSNAISSTRFDQLLPKQHCCHLSWSHTKMLSLHLQMVRTSTSPLSHYASHLQRSSIQENYPGLCT